MTTFQVESPTVLIERAAGVTMRHTFATARTAQVHHCIELVRAAGWRVEHLGQRHHGWRRPWLLSDEKMMTPLDGGLADERAQGFTARLGTQAVKPDDPTIVIDACAGLPVRVLFEQGDTTVVRGIVTQILGEIEN